MLRSMGSATCWPSTTPRPIHQGNGKVAVFIDDKASDKQAEALTMILSGQAGGMPFEALAGAVGGFASYAVTSWTNQR